MPPTPAPAAPPEGQGQQPAEGEPLDELEAALGDDPADGDGGQPAEEWTPPTREEWAAAQAALEAERAKLKRARTQAQKLREAKRPEAPAQPAGDGQEGGAAAGPDPQLAVWQARAVRASAKAGLLDRGADPEMVDLALGRLKPDEIDFTEDDEPDLDAWLDDVQDRYPKLFAKPEAAAQQGARRPMGAVDQGSAKGRPVQRQMTYGERVIANSEAAARSAGRRRSS
jgi:hypothetical protein